MTKKEAIRIVEESIQRHQEIKVIQRKEKMIERKHSTVEGYHFCPDCGTWTPEEPPEVKALGREWVRIFNREVEKVRKMKSAA